MADKINMVLNNDYWDGIASVKGWNQICYGFLTEEDFYKFTEPIDELRSDMRFLDFGCGPGRIVKTVAPRVKEYVGVDVSAGLLSIAKEHHAEYTNVAFIQCNGVDLQGIDDNSVDFLYERLVFIHIRKEHIIHYLDEFYRVLAPGGILRFVDFPKEEHNTNGFTREEVEALFSKYTQCRIDGSGILYDIRCIK